MKHPKTGILVPLFSLPSESGIGELGYHTIEFLHILKKHNLKLWQMLPIGPVNYENSPYSALSSYGIEPIYISLEMLIEMGYPIEIHRKEFGTRVDYPSVIKHKRKHLLIAYELFLNNPTLCQDPAFLIFQTNNPWAIRVAEFVAKYYFFNETNWNTWPKEVTIENNVELGKEFAFQLWAQYVADVQFNRIKGIAHDLGIEIIGDVPFYVGFNSMEVFFNQDKFLLDENLDPAWVAGVPPDYFSVTGQNWKNPIWNWKNLEAEKYNLFIDRLGYCATAFDYVRLDHFRAFDTYYCIPGKDETALNGHWERLDGYKVFDELFVRFPHVKLICEDLGGDMNDRIPALRDFYNLPGMKEIEFTILSDFHEGVNFMRYTGTHDNEPLLSWYEEQSEEDKIRILKVLEDVRLTKYFKTAATPNVMQRLIAYFLKCNSLLGIISVVDLLELGGKENRINAPGSVADVNWSWRFESLKELDQKLDFYNID